MKVRPISFPRKDWFMSLLNLLGRGRPKVKGPAISAEEKIQKINEYFLALDKINKRGSTTACIDDLLSLMDDDVMYIHEDYGARFNKSSWRKAFMRNMTRGAYNNGPNEQIRVLNTIVGNNYAAVEYSHGKLLENNAWEGQDPCLALFGFSGGRISLVQEYW